MNTTEKEETPADESIPEIEMQLENIIEHPEKSESLESIRKFLIFSVLGILLFILAYNSPFAEYFQRISELGPIIQKFGFAAPFIFTISTAVLVLFGFPRLVLCSIAGMLFGFTKGLICSTIGTLIAYYLVFIFVRKTGHGFRFHERINKGHLGKLLGKSGIPAVILVRQLPIHGMIVNTLLGFSPISHFDFLVGTIIGLIPEAAPFTLIGTGAAQGDLKRTVFYLVIAIVMLAILWLAFICYKNIKSKKERLK